jgi:hypothetical protein
VALRGERLAGKVAYKADRLEQPIDLALPRQLVGERADGDDANKLLVAVGDVGAGAIEIAGLVDTTRCERGEVVTDAAETLSDVIAIDGLQLGDLVGLARLRRQVIAADTVVQGDADQSRWIDPETAGRIGNLRTRVDHQSHLAGTIASARACANPV